MSVWVFQEHGATALGLFGVARYVSMAVLGPLMATAADRFPKRLVMVSSDIARAVTVVVAAAVIATDGPAAAVYALGLLTSIFSLAFRPAQAALLPRLATDPQQLTSANVVSSTIESLGFFVGPALAGFLLAVTDVEVVYLVNAASFVVSASAQPSRRTSGAAAADDGREQTADERQAASSATRWPASRIIRDNRNLRLVTALMAAQTVVAGASLVYEVSIALDLLDMGESGLGLLDAVLGVGGILGGFVVLVLARRERLASDFGIGVILWAAPLLLIVAVPSLATTLVAMFLIGIANSMVDVNVYTIVQRVAPTDVMGRVFGAFESLLTLGMAIGALVMPLLIESSGCGPAWSRRWVGHPRRVGGSRWDGSTRRCWPPPAWRCRGVPMLTVLPPPVTSASPTCSCLTVPAGEVVFREGDDADRYWIIERGRPWSASTATSGRSGPATASARSPCCATSRARRRCAPATRSSCCGGSIATTSSPPSPATARPTRSPTPSSSGGCRWADGWLYGGRSAPQCLRQPPSR